MVFTATKNVHLKMVTEKGVKNELYLLWKDFQIR